MANTLLLDRGNWDLCLDAGGNIAVAGEPYSQAQDISSECRVFVGECYYDTGRGIPFRTLVLGRNQPMRVLKERVEQAALRVPGVTQATALLARTDRQVVGEIQFQSPAGGGVAAL